MIQLALPPSPMAVFWVDNKSLRPETGLNTVTRVGTTRDLLLLGIVNVAEMISHGKEICKKKVTIHHYSYFLTLLFFKRVLNFNEG